MKRVLSVLLIASVLAVSICLPNCVFALGDAEITAVFDENIDGADWNNVEAVMNDTLTAQMSNGKQVVSFPEWGTTDIDKLKYGNVMKFHLGATDIGTPIMEYSLIPENNGVFAEISSENASAKIVETEFDISFDGMGRPINLTLGDKNDNNVFKLNLSDTGRLYMYVGDSAVRIGPSAYPQGDGKMHRMKLVTKLSWDSDANKAVNSVVAVYFDGVLQNYNDLEYPLAASTEDVRVINQIKLSGQNNKGEGEKCIWLDNLSVVTYEAEAPIERYVDLSELEDAIITYGSLLGSTRYTEEQIKSLEAEINSAVAAYKKINATQTEIDDAKRALVSFGEELGGIYVEPEQKIRDELAQRSLIEERSAFYDSEAYEAYVSACEAAEGVLGIGTLEAVNAALNDLVNAREKLVIKECVQTILFENFEDDDFSYTVKTDSNPIDVTMKTVFDKDFYGRSAEFNLKDEAPSADAPTFYYKMSPTNSSAFYNPDTDKEMYVDVDFDISIFGSAASTRGVYVGLAGGINLWFDQGTLRINHDGGRLDNEGVYTEEVMSHVKIVLQYFDENGNPVNKVKGVYIDGELLNGSTQLEKTIGSLTDVQLYAALKNAKITEVGCHFDNFSITKYNSLSGSSAAPMRAEAIVNLAKSKKAVLESSIADDEKQVLYSQLAELGKRYQNSNDVDEIMSVFAGAKSIANMVAASGAFGNAETFPPTVYGDIFSGEIKIYADSLSDKSKKLYLATLLSLNNSESDGFGSSELKDIQIKTIDLTANEIGSTNFTVDLNKFSQNERSELSLNLVTFEVDNQNNISLADVFGLAGNQMPIPDKTYSYTDTAEVSQKVLSETKSKMIVTLKAVPNEDVLLFVLKKNSDFSVFDTADTSQIASETEYAATAKADENGNVLFEFIPSEGQGEYYMSVIRADMESRQLISFFEFAHLEAMVDDLNSQKSKDVVEQYKKELSINEAVYNRAVKNGQDIESEIEELLEARTYTVYDFNDFSKEFLKRLDIISTIRSASNVDMIEDILVKNSGYIENYSKIKNIRNVSEYAFKNKKKVDSVKTLNEVVDGGMNQQSGGGGNSGGGSGSSGGRTPSNPGQQSFGNSGGVLLSGDEYAEDRQNTGISEAMSKFSDLDGYDWAKEAIVVFTALGYVNGKESDKFAPGDTVTREEFVKMAIMVFGMYDEQAEADFNDVNKNEWYYKYVASAYKNGIVNGIGNNNFGIGNNLSREDLACIVHRMMSKNNVPFTEDGLYIEFVDESLIAEYAVDAVKDLAKSGIINGIGGNEFAPGNMCTRAEAIKMLYMAYKLF